MNLDGIQAITFDAADTLIAPYPSVGEVYAKELAKLGYDLSPKVLENNFRNAFRQLKREQPDAFLNRDGWRTIVTNTLQGLTRSDDFDRQFEALWNAFAQPDRWRVMPGVEETLKCLRADGLRLFVLSNNDARLHGILDGLGIGQYFEAVLISTELGAEKPSAHIFEVAQSRIQAEPATILHVGDSPVEDVQGALHAGWRAALIGPRAETSAAMTIFNRASNIRELFFGTKIR